MDEAVDNVIRRIETKFAELAGEVEQLRADRLMLARELHRVRGERDRLLAERSRSAATAPEAPTRPGGPTPSAPVGSSPPPDAPVPSSVSRSIVDEPPVIAAQTTTDESLDGAGDATLSDADWERLGAARRNSRS